MKRLRLAIVGFGRVGRACAQVMAGSEDVVLTGIVRRPEQVNEELPPPFSAIPRAAHIGELPEVDAALICVPVNLVQGISQSFLSRRTPIVECAILHGEVFQQHHAEIHRVAFHHKVAAIVGAGWDPGALSMFRCLFGLLIPKGHTETTRRPGLSLHHTLVAQSIPGVKDALSTELPIAGGKVQRYVYVELANGADQDEVVQAIRSDPQFLDIETLIFSVDSIASLEDEGHGVVLERRAASGQTGHARFLLEGRFDESFLTARIMLAAARVLPSCKPGAWSLLELPLAALWGELAAGIENEYL